MIIKLKYIKLFILLALILSSKNVAAVDAINSSGVGSIDQNCTFLQSSKKPGIQGLISDAETILKNLQQGKEQCRLPKNEYDTLHKSIEAFKNYEQIPDDYQMFQGNHAGLFEDAQISCYNYKSLLNSTYTAFISNLSKNGTSTQYLAKSKLKFSECYKEADPAGCASVLNQTYLNDYTVACANKREIIQERNSEVVRSDGILSIQKLVNQSLSKMTDPVCREDLSSVYNETARATLNIGAQVATLNSVPSLAGLGMMGAVGILDSMISFLNERQDFLKEISNETNFNTVACFYKAVQNKAFNCAGYQLGNKIEVLKNSISINPACEAVTSQSFLIQKELSDQIAKIVITEPADKSKTDRTAVLDKIVETIDGRNPAEQEFWNDFKIKLEDLSRFDENNPEISKTFKLNEGSRNQRRIAKENFDSFKKRLEKIKKIFAAQEQSKNSLSNQSLESAIQEFAAENKGDFILYVDEILNASAKTKNEPPSAFLAKYTARQQIQKDYYESIEQLHNTSPGREVGLVFQGLNDNFSSLVEARIKKISIEMEDVKKTAPSSSLAERANQFSQTIKPLLDACALLEPSVLMIDINSIKSSNSDFMKTCSSFACPDGSGIHLTEPCGGSSFLDIFSSKNASNNSINKLNCDKKTNNLEQYKRNICDQDAKYNMLLKKFQNEYVEKGTVCGK